MARIAGGASSAAADARSRPSAFRRDGAVVDGHAAALAAGFTAADTRAVGAAGGRNGAVIDDHGAAVFFIAAADARAIVAAVGGQAAVVDGDCPTVDFIAAADAGAVRAAGGGQAAAQHLKAAAGVRARLVAGTDARSIVAAVCRDRAAVDRKVSAAGLITAADARGILRAGADQCARILLLTVDAQTVVRGKLNALAALQRRPVAEDQVHIAADGQAVGKAAALGDDPNAAGQSQVFVVLQGGNQLEIRGLDSLGLDLGTGPPAAYILIGGMELHRHDACGHNETDCARFSGRVGKGHGDVLFILVGVSYSPGPALEALAPAVDEICRHGDGLPGKGLPLVRIQAEVRIFLRHDPPGALQLCVDDRVRVGHDEISVKVEEFVISHVSQLLTLGHAVFLPGDPGAPDAVAAHVLLVLHVQLRRNGVARHGALLIGGNGEVDLICGKVLEIPAPQHLSRLVGSGVADPVADLHEVRRHVDVVLRHGKGVCPGQLAAGGRGRDAAAGQRELQRVLPLIFVQPEDLQPLRAVVGGIAAHDRDRYRLLMPGALLVQRDGVARLLRV